MALYCLAKSVFFSGNITYYSYRDRSDFYRNGASPLCALWFTNDPATYDPDLASHYVEWAPGISEFPAYCYMNCIRLYPLDPPYKNETWFTTVQRKDIVNIFTFDGEYVKCPEDCTGLFSNMSLGFTGASQYMHDHYWWYNRNSPDEDWPSTPTVDNNNSTDNTTTVKINFSGFDFSNTKNFTSLFENCLGSTKSYSLYYSDYHEGLKGTDRWIWQKSYHRLNLQFYQKHVEFTGLGGWETSNIENISRMFTNINWNVHSIDGYTGPFNTDGINNFDLPKVTNVANLFANSTINVGETTFNLGGNTIDLSFAFSNYGTVDSGGSGSLNISGWSIDATDGNLQSMFRNTKLSSIQLGSLLDSVVTGMSTSANLNYMFCSDSTTSNLQHISVKNLSDWKEMNPNIDGYKMFLNCTKLPNYIVGETNILHANNTRTTGYFDQAPPEKVTMTFFKKRVSGTETWLESDVYIKKENGWKPVTEVYI